MSTQYLVIRAGSICLPIAVATPTPATPAGITATANGNSEIDVTWTASSGATSYTVQRSPDGSTGWATVGTPSASPYDDTGLSAATTYYYRVSASNGAGASAYSSAADATTSAAAGPVLLEDFSGGSSRLTVDGTQALWSPYLGVNPTQTQSISGNILTLSTGTSGYSDGTGISTGSNTSNTLNDTTQSWTVGQFSGGPSGSGPINIVSGTGAGQWAMILSNTSTQITIAGTWATTPDATSHYRCYQPEAVYQQFYPNGASDGYAYPNGYVQTYIKSGTWDPDCTKMSFWLRPDCSVARRSDGGYWHTLANYVRQKTETDKSFQGNHYYYQFDDSVYAGRWIKYWVNRQAQHRVGGNPNYNWPLDPEFQVGTITNNGQSYTFPSVSENGDNTPYHFFDILSRWYIEFSVQQASSLASASVLYGSSWDFADFEFSSVSVEPDDLVSSISVTYNGSGYDINHAGPKNTTQSYTYYWSLSPMQNTDGSYDGTGTPIGTASATGDAYTGVWISTAPMSQQSLIYFFVQPSGRPNGTQLAMPSGPTL